MGESYRTWIILPYQKKQRMYSKDPEFWKKNRQYYTVVAVLCLFVAVHVPFIYYLFLFIFYIFTKKISVSDCSYIVLIFRAISASVFILSLFLIKKKSVIRFEFKAGGFSSKQMAETCESMHASSKMCSKNLNIIQVFSKAL